MIMLMLTKIITKSKITIKDDVIVHHLFVLLRIIIKIKPFRLYIIYFLEGFTFYFNTIHSVSKDVLFLLYFLFYKLDIPFYDVY